MSTTTCCDQSPVSRATSANAVFWGHRALKNLNRVDAAIVALVAAIALAIPSQATPTAKFVLAAIVHILPFFIVSIVIAASIKASSAERVIGRVFSGGPTRSIAMGALFGAFSPLCSCGVIPVVASLLSAGVPLAPVMTFWIASPAMDPELFFLIAGTLGISFAAAKTLAVLVIAIVGGTIVHVLQRAGWVTDPLRRELVVGCGAGLATGPVVLKFWQEQDRRSLFVQSAIKTALPLMRWLLLAFLIESLMVRYVPAGLVAEWLGGGIGGIAAAAALGAPAYLNSYAAIPLVGGLVDMGMSPAVALTFLLAGTMTSMPAAMAVWATVRPKVFVIYVSVALLGSFLSGLVYSLFLMT